MGGLGRSRGNNTETIIYFCAYFIFIYICRRNLQTKTGRRMQVIKINHCSKNERYELLKLKLHSYIRSHLATEMGFDLTIGFL